MIDLCAEVETKLCQPDMWQNLMDGIEIPLESRRPGFFDYALTYKDDTPPTIIQLEILTWDEGRGFSVRTLTKPAPPYIQRIHAEITISPYASGSMVYTRIRLKTGLMGCLALIYRLFLRGTIQREFIKALAATRYELETGERIAPTSDFQAPLDNIRMVSCR